MDGFEYRHCPTHADKERILSEMDVFTLPTVYQEPKGLSVLEAWATGVPAVLPAHGSFPELLEQALLISAEPGVRYPPGDQEFLVEQLSRLLLDPEERATLAYHARQAVELRFNATRMAYETAHWYHSLPEPG
jgi:glycosyltransferase involved in cell wall biosynthesis